jgi:sulfotransferase family protein
LLAQAAPEARLLLMLRDPVERFRSGLAHQLRHRAAPTGATVTEAVARGFYDLALVRWSEHFPPDRVLVLQYERCAADPGGELARTYGFLGLDDGFRPPNLHRAVAVTTEGKVDLDDDARLRLVDTYAPDVRALMARFPELDLTLWPNFAALAPS